MVKENGKIYSTVFKMLPEIQFWTGRRLWHLEIGKLVLTGVCEK